MKNILFVIMLMLTSTYAGFDFKTCSGSGSFEQQINNYNGDFENAITVGEIPKGIKGLDIQLNSTKDVDIRLYSDSNDKIVHWPNGILNKASLETKSYQKTKITYSGYNGVNEKKGEEFIKIPSTTPTKMIMKAFGYEAGYATVNYSWTGKEGCTASKSGEGNFTQEVLNKKTNLVGTIPAGLDNVYIELTSDKDIDIQLYAKDGTAIVSWKPKGLISASNKQNITYHEMDIEWSGYNGIDGQAGHEYIKISNKTSEMLTMKVFGYESGIANVTYKWGDKNITACTYEYAPVCGLTNPCHADVCPTVLPIYKTFSNLCHLNAAKAELAYEGECNASNDDNATACTKEYAPVCGITNCPEGTECFAPPIYKTFGNMCTLKVAKAKLAYEGECNASNEDNNSYKTTITIKPKKVDCMGMAFMHKCLQIKEEGSSIWKDIDYIQNFTHEEGYKYKAVVKVTKLDPAPQDISDTVYTLVNILKKDLVDDNVTSSCISLYAPVCGITNCPEGTECFAPPVYKTFSNSCWLKVAKAKLAYEGECKTSDKDILLK